MSGAAMAIDRRLLVSAREQCVECGGLGTVIRKGKPVPCACAWRGVGRACLEFEAKARCGEMPTQTPYGYELLAADWRADFRLAWAVLDAAEAEALREQRGVPREDRSWYHVLYKAEAKLGRECYHRGLWPFASYFSVHQVPPQPYVGRKDGRRVKVARMSPVTDCREVWRDAA